MQELTEKEIAAAMELNAEYRQALFFERSKSIQGLFILAGDDGPFLLEDLEADDDNQTSTVIPVWNDESFAKAYLQSEALTGVSVRFVSAKTWNENWVPMLLENKVLEGFMPVSGKDFSVDDPKVIPEI